MFIMRISFTNDSLFFASWSTSDAEAENTPKMSDFRKSLRLSVLALDEAREGLRRRLFAIYPRHFSVVKMPSTTVTKALHESKGCLLYRYNDAFQHSWKAS